jgi:large subunit ribosomal protein L21
MFAVVRTGGKQYRVAAGDKIVVEKMAGNAGDTVSLNDVLLAGDGGEMKSLDGLLVSAEIIAQAKADKIIVFKKKRRHNYRRKNGHRQQHTILKILSVGGEAAKPAAKAAKAPKAEAAPAAVTAEAIDASNLSLISGIGRLDTELKLGGRATKEEWVDQAKELLAGKAPRAKADQAEKASGKDK